MTLKEHLQLLFTKNNGKELMKVLKEKVDNKVIYTDVNESEVTELFNEFYYEKKKESLNEAVTFIDNAGNLKTMNVEDYNKNMHEYNTDTEIEKYKKKNKKEYKLIEED